MLRAIKDDHCTMSKIISRAIYIEELISVTVCQETLFIIMRKCTVRLQQRIGWYCRQLGFLCGKSLPMYWLRSRIYHLRSLVLVRWWERLRVIVQEEQHEHMTVMNIFASLQITFLCKFASPPHITCCVFPLSSRLLQVVYKM